MNLKSFIKIPLVLLENIAFSIFPNSRPIIEKYIYNPYQFNKKHLEYSKNQFENFIKKIGGLEKIKNKIIFELGPGGSLGFGFLALQNGAYRYLAVEDGQHVFIEKKQLVFYKELLNDDETIINKLFVFKNGKVSYNPKVINFIKINQNSKYDLGTASVDFIYSCAVLEHVHDPNLCFSEMTRILKPMGIMNHQIDLRDHIFSQNNLWFLGISDFWFKLLFGKTGEYVNRKRFSYYINLIEKYRFKILEIKKDILSNKKFPKGLLNNFSENDLKISSFNITIEKCAE